jgi:hypothetical protein
MSSSEYPKLRQLFDTVPIDGMDVIKEAAELKREIGSLETEAAAFVRDPTQRQKASKYVASILDAHYSFGNAKILPNVYSLAHRISRREYGDPEMTLDHVDAYGVRLDYITYSHWDKDAENVRGEAVLLYDDPDDEHTATHLFIATTEPWKPEIILQIPPDPSAAVYAYNQIGGAIQQCKEAPEADVIPLVLRD